MYINSKNVKFIVVDDDNKTKRKKLPYIFEIKISKEFLNQCLATNTNLYTGRHINLYKMTKRERQVLQYIVDGKNNTQIAKELDVSVNTAKAHVSNVFSKLHVQSRTDAAVKAIKSFLVQI